MRKKLRPYSRPKTLPFANFWEKVTKECAPACKDGLFLRDFAHDEETIANLSRIYTNAGKFNAYLNDCNKSDIRDCPNCGPGVEDTIDHFLYECPKFRVQRDHSNIMLEDSWSNRADFVRTSGRKI